MINKTPSVQDKPVQDADVWMQKRLKFCNSHMIKNIKAIMRQEIETAGCSETCFMISFRIY